MIYFEEFLSLEKYEEESSWKKKRTKKEKNNSLQKKKKKKKKKETGWKKKNGTPFITYYDTFWLLFFTQVENCNFHNVRQLTNNVAVSKALQLTLMPSIKFCYYRYIMQVGDSYTFSLSFSYNIILTRCLALDEADCVRGKKE